MDKDKFLKLPLYARDEINRLMRDLDYMRHQVAQLDGTTDTRITWTSGIHDGDHGLPEHATVTFVVWNSVGNKTEIEVSLGGDDERALKIRSTSGRISIEPDSGSNCVIIRAIR